MTYQVVTDLEHQKRLGQKMGVGQVEYEVESIRKCRVVDREDEAGLVSGRMMDYEPGDTATASYLKRKPDSIPNRTN
jgi:hypothetical protein